MISAKLRSLVRLSYFPLPEDIEKPITAQPVGAPFVAQTHGYVDIDYEHQRSRAVEERLFTSTDDGCFRCEPTCKE